MVPGGGQRRSTRALMDASPQDKPRQMGDGHRADGSRHSPGSQLALLGSAWRVTDALFVCIIRVVSDASATMSHTVASSSMAAISEQTAGVAHGARGVRLDGDMWPAFGWP